jgi:hypothetical protein
VHWIKRFIFFNGKRHPDAMGEAEVTAFLNHHSRPSGEWLQRRRTRRCRRSCSFTAR